MRSERLPRLAAALVCLASLCPARDDAPPLVVPDGLAVSLWAESPLVYNPTAIDVDAAGRLWVTEAVNYRKWGGRNPGREHPEGDRVVVLEDVDGDGRADRSTVFAQDVDLVAPLGIAVIGERVFVSCSPHLFVYHDDDGDLRADRRETFLTGFGGFNHDHGLHSVVFAPSGRLILNTGNAGPHLVTDAAGWSLRSGSAYDGGGPKLAGNRAGLVSDDGRAWVGGLILGVERDGTGLGVHAHNFRNNYEVAVDAFGNRWQSDNDDDGNQGCRTLWCMEGGNYGYMSADGTRFWGVDRRPGQTTQEAHWRQHDPGVMPAGTINGAGGPTGVAIYEHGVLAPWFDGIVLNCDAGAGVVYGHRPTAAGAGYELEAFDVVAPDAGVDEPRATWFRPSDVAVGTDGCLYVADWYDPGVGGHWAGDREAYGRILRVTPARENPTAPTLDVSTPDGARAALVSPAVNVRVHGFDALTDGSDAMTDALRTMSAADDPRERARALWALADVGDVKAVYAGVSDREPEVRVTALRALRRMDAARTTNHTVVLSAYLDRAGDRSAAVRREVALFLGDERSAAMTDRWVQLALQHDGRDRFALEALGMAATGREAALWDAYAEHASDPWSERDADIAWRLHPPTLRDTFVARASDEGLQHARRRQAVDALGFLGADDRAANEALLTLALGGPTDTRDLAGWWVERNDAQLAESLGGDGVEGAERVFASGTVKGWAGVTEIDVDVAGAEEVFLVATDAGNGNACDWVAWVEPRFVMEDGTTRALTDGAWLSAECAWGSVNVDADCVGGALTVDGDAVRGLGTHAPSTIGYAVPAGAARLLVGAAPEDDGSKQSDGSITSVTFEAWVRRPESREHLAAWERTLLDDAADDEVRLDALESLAADVEGGLILIDLAERGALTDDQRDDVADVIHDNPDASVRALASAHFPREAADGSVLPPVAELARMPGDPRAGAALFRSDEAMCSTCHRMRGFGADIGPDLTEIRSKLDASALVDAILNPSAAIAFGYDTSLFTLRDGTRVSGFVLAAGDDVVVKTTNGDRRAFPATDVVERRKLVQSTMPHVPLNAQQLADLRAFLSEDTSAEPVFGDEVVLFDGTRGLDGWTHHLNAAGADPADTWSIVDGVLRCEGQPIGYLRTEDVFEDFELTLEWRFDPARGAGNSGVLLRTVGDDRVWPTSIEAQLHSGNAGDIWNIGEVPMVTDANRTNGRRTVKRAPSSERPLGEWNRYRIRLHDDRLTLEVNGVVQNEATWCADRPGWIALQSEGAYIEFRDVRLRPIVD